MEYNKIFVVGFPKCGTTSIHYSILTQGIKSIHWAKDPDLRTNLVGVSIRKAKENGLPLLNYLNNYRAFTQMESCIDQNNCYWPQLQDIPLLEKQYPNSRFIFNDRNPEKWIKSVTNWNISIGNLRSRLVSLDIPGLPAGVGHKDSELLDWYDWHKSNMIKFFEGKSNFIIFNVEKDEPQKLGNFLGIKEFYLPHLNRSKDASKE
jgi:hypothetical protein